MKQRAQAAAYDWFVLTGLGTVVMTGTAWISGRDLFEDGGTLAAAILALFVMDALYGYRLPPSRDRPLASGWPGFASQRSTAAHLVGRERSVASPSSCRWA